MASKDEILKAASKAMRKCKRDDSGTVIGSALKAIKNRFAWRLIDECGVSRGEAICAMHDLAETAVKA